MAQYKTGTVSVTTGSAIVTGVGTLFLANVAVGNTFKRKDEDAVYSIGAVNSNTQITLTANYAGVTGSGLEYQITRDFTVNCNIAEVSDGDIDVAYHLTQETVRKIDAIIAKIYNAGAAYTPGSIIFAGTGGAFNQDNANLFWDNVNKRLGIGTAPGAYKLNVNGSIKISAASGSIIGGGGNFDLYQNTSDGSDNAVTRIGGGGDVSVGRGAFATFHGNEVASLGGDLYLTPGTGGDVIVDSGNVGIGTPNPVISGTGKLHMAADTMRLDTARTPASAIAAGNAGEICWDALYVYTCIAANTWRRVAHATW